MVKENGPLFEKIASDMKQITFGKWFLFDFLIGYIYTSKESI